MPDGSEPWALLGGLGTNSVPFRVEMMRDCAVASGLGAVIFDFDGLMIDSERVEADCIIEALACWGATVSYVDFGHLFGSVDSDAEWEELLTAWCGRTARELDDLIRPRATVLKDALPLMPGVRELMDAATERGLPFPRNVRLPCL